MPIRDWMRRIFKAPDATPADEPRLSGASESALACSLQKLPAGERGWITLAEAARLFSGERQDYAFGELDEAGKDRLAQFASRHRSTPDFRPVEQEYFRRTGAFPPQHLIVLRREAWEAHRWIARNLTQAFSAANDAFTEAQKSFPYATPWLEAELELLLAQTDTIELPW